MTQFEDKNEKQSDLIINQDTGIDFANASFTARPQESNYEPILDGLVQYSAGADSYEAGKYSYADSGFTRVTTIPEDLDPKGESNNTAGTLFSSGISEILEATNGRAVSSISTVSNRTEKSNADDNSIQSIQELPQLALGA